MRLIALKSRIAIGLILFVFLQCVPVVLSQDAGKKPSKPKVRIDLPGENLTLFDRPGFIFLPEPAKRTTPQPWIFYAPTLPQYPDEAERWMHEQFLAAGIAVAGIDVGEAFGSPQSLRLLDALYDELTKNRGFASKPCLFGRSRGGLWVSSWACAHPDRVAGIIGIYPVFDFASYPGLAKTAAAYELSVEELEKRKSELNPITKIERLAEARIPVTIIHGDEDKVVPLKENSLELLQRYDAVGAKELVNLIVPEGKATVFGKDFLRNRPLSISRFNAQSSEHGTFPILNARPRCDGIRKPVQSIR